MINKYLGGPVQRTKRHLGVWMNLSVSSVKNQTPSNKKTDPCNSTDERIESAEGLTICSLDGIDREFRLATDGVYACDLYIAWSLNGFIILIVYRWNGLCTYLVDGNCSTSSRINGCFDGCEVSRIKLIYCTLILQTQLADA